MHSAIDKIERLTNAVREHAALLPEEIATDDIYAAAGAVLSLRRALR